VDLVGIEPTTSSMPWKRAPSCATGPFLEDTSVLAWNLYYSRRGGEDSQRRQGIISARERKTPVSAISSVSFHS
jgi:hypothetical protein